MAELVRRHDRASITLWASFNHRILRKCRAAVRPRPLYMTSHPPRDVTHPQ